MFRGPGGRASIITEDAGAENPTRGGEPMAKGRSMQKEKKKPKQKKK
jgi:hypothetical protein